MFTDAICEHICPGPAGHHQTLFWCSGCGIVTCNNCWELQAAHNPNAWRPVAANSHEKTDLSLAEVILSILHPEEDPEKQQQLHEQNVTTKWFGVSQNPDSGRAQFDDFGRYVRLAGGSELDPTTFYPCLISFVGETGQGKSTLINALIKVYSFVRALSYHEVINISQMKSDSTQRTSNIVPVIGSNTLQDCPTSGDVHLFADPESYNSAQPLYYADCEGLDGNNLPLATAALERMKPRKHGDSRIPKAARTMIQWATEEQNSRQWAVANLYPRVLFTFSDVVCYVTRNFR
jgi:hypothetical protein